jgi:hypothetical protein
VKSLMDNQMLSDRELLLLVADDVSEVKTLINGNGQPGLVTRLAKVEARMDEEVPSTARRTTFEIGSVIALLAGVGTFLKQVFNIG